MSRYVLQRKVDYISKICIKENYVTIHYYWGKESKSFLRSHVRFREREASWLGLKKRIDIYVNDFQHDTIDPRFDIDAIIAHPDLKVERA